MIATEASGMSAISENDVIINVKSIVKKNITKILEKTLKNILETAFRPFLKAFMGEISNTTLAGIKPDIKVVKSDNKSTIYNTKIIGKNIWIIPLISQSDKIKYDPIKSTAKNGKSINVRIIE